VTRAVAGTRGADGGATVAGGVGFDTTGADTAGCGALAVAPVEDVEAGAVDVVAGFVGVGAVAVRLGAGAAGGVVAATGAVGAGAVAWAAGGVGADAAGSLPGGEAASASPEVTWIDVA